VKPPKQILIDEDEYSALKAQVIRGWVGLWVLFLYILASAAGLIYMRLERDMSMVVMTPPIPIPRPALKPPFTAGERVLVVWMSDNVPHYEASILEFSADGEYAKMSAPGTIHDQGWEQLKRLRHLQNKEIKAALAQ
jgi:hypothetical protein